MSSSALSTDNPVLGQQDEHPGLCEPDQGPSSELRRRHGDANAPPTVMSQRCHCKSCPVVKRDLLYYEEENESISQLDHPLSQCDGEKDVRAIGRRIACQYHLNEFRELFEKAALLVYDRNWFRNSTSQQPKEPTVLHQPNGDVATPFHRSNQATAFQQDDITVLQDKPAPKITTTQEKSSRDGLKLTDDEIIALNNEPKLGFWDTAPPFRTTCYMLFTAAVVQGWNQTSTNGTNVCYLDDLIRDPNTPMSSFELNDYGCIRGTNYDLKYGAISAAPFLFGFVGCWLADPLNEVLMGRRRAILVSTIFIFVSAIASAFVQRWWQLLLCRVFLAIGMGGKAAVVPVFLAEIAPNHIRAATIMNWQVFDALGIALGFTANLLASEASPEAAFRWQVASSTIPAFALLIGLLLVSWDSPRFEMKLEATMYNRFLGKSASYDGGRNIVADSEKDVWPVPNGPNQHEVDTRPETASQASRNSVQLPSVLRRSFDAIRYLYGPHPGFPYRSKAFDTLVLLRKHPMLAAKELVYTHCQMVIQQLGAGHFSGKEDDIDFAIRNLKYRHRLRDLFRRKSYLSRELTAAVIVMIAQQTSGINVLIFYSARVFTGIGQSSNSSPDKLDRTPVFLGWGIGLANVVFAIPAYWLIQSRGRRWLVLKTMPFLTITMALAAGSFQFTDPLTRRSTVATSTFLFTAFYSPGLGPVPFTLSAELFPLEYRMVGMSLVVSINFLIGGIFSLFVPLVPLHSESYLLGAFAIANFVAWFFVHRYVREPEVRPFGTQPGSSAVGQEAIYQIYKPDHSKHSEFQLSHKWDAVRIIKKFFGGSNTEGDVLEGRHYFLDWVEDHPE